VRFTDPLTVEAFRTALRGELLVDEPLSGHTSLKTGGPADLFALPRDEEDLATLLGLARQRGVPATIVGRGYNTLVRDGGIRGVVISLRHLETLERRDDGRIMVGAGVWSTDLARFAQSCSLSGLEFLVGIPGSVGGLLAMNAGAHGGAILGTVETLYTVRDGEPRQYPRAELTFGYRFLALAPGEIITRALLHLDSEAASVIAGRMEDLLAQRSACQTVGKPNAGSFFKNPPGAAAWKLIDDAGLRGTRVGDAQVSEVHANFLVNLGGATTADFLSLAALIKERVRTTSGIELEEEVVIMGEDQ
jgi:UDP-N-acetylmuramate dehydrogenase